MDQNQNMPLFQLNIDPGTSYTLKSAASWGKVLAIVTLIMGVLMCLMGFVFQNRIGEAATYDEDFTASDSKLAGQMAMIVYLLIGIVCIVGGIFMLNFSNKISTALKTNDQASLNSGFASLRNYIAYWAILTILSTLMLLIGIAGLATTPMK